MHCIYAKQATNKVAKTECETATKVTKICVNLNENGAIKMVRIDINSAYDLVTQNDLFRQVCEENIEDSDEYSKAQIKMDKQQFGCWKSITEMAHDLMKIYVKAWQNEADSIDDTLGYYTIVDYSSMLRDDLLTGYFNIVKCKNGEFVLHMTPEGAENSLFARIH